MRMKSSYWRVTCASIALVAMAASAQAKDVIRFMHNETTPESIDFFNKAIEEFEKANPDIEVQMETVSTDGRLQKVTAAAAAKTIPDIFKILPEEQFPFSQRGYIANLDGLVAEMGKDNFTPGSLTLVDGKIYSIPYTLGNFGMLFYRKDLLDAKGVAVPKTWDEMEKAAEALTGDGVFGFVIPAGKNRMTTIFLSTLMWSAGGTYFDKDLNVTFDNPATIKALEFMKRMAKYSPPGIGSYSYNQLENAFLTGTVAMLDFYNGSLTNNLMNNRPDLLEKTSVAPLPVGSSGVGVKYVSADSFSLGTPEVGANHVEAASKFVEYIVSGSRAVDFSLTRFPHLIPPLTTDQPAVKEAGLPQLKGRAEFADLAFDTSNGLDFHTEAGAVIKDGKVIESGITNPYMGAIISRDIPAIVVQRVVLEGEDPATAVAWGAEEMKKIVEDLKNK